MKIKKITSALFSLVMFFAAQSAFAVAPSNTANLVGTWVNVNPAGGIVKAVITYNALTGFKINTYGACTPTPCNHGTISATRFSKSISSNVSQALSAQYNFGFKTMLVTAQRRYDFDGGAFLELENRNKFAAGDNRIDYSQTELFRRQ